MINVRCPLSLGSETDSAIQLRSQAGRPLLTRVIANNGVVLYQSPLLGSIAVPHAFTTRIGGVSKPPFDSLNLGGTTDSPDNIAENFRRLTDAAACSGRQIKRTSQIHSADFIWVNSTSTAPHKSADAILSEDPRCIPCIRIADCVPVLIASEDGRLVAAVHAGWRGIIKGVIPAALAALKARAAKNTNFLAAIGPCISVNHFEVGPEVAIEFTNLFGPSAPILRLPNCKPHINLPHAIHLQLRATGLSHDHIDTTDRCTFRHRDEFFSHRRDHAITGRMAAIIASRA